MFGSFYSPQNNAGTACINVWEVLARNSNFAHFKAIYDQVRIDGVKVSLSVTDASTTINNYNQVKNTTIYTAWDKTGLSIDQVLFEDRNEAGIPKANFDDTNVYSYVVKVGKGITNCSSVRKSILNSFQRWNHVMANYPTLINEKGQFVSTSSIRLFNTGTNWNSGKVTLADDYRQTVNQIISSENPVCPFESSSVRYKPCVLVQVFNNAQADGSITQYGRCDTVVFNAEFNISVTFKNLKAAKYVKFKLLNYKFIYILFNFFVNFLKKRL